MRKYINQPKRIKLAIVAILAIACLMLCACGTNDGKGKEFNTLEDLKDAKFALSDTNSSYEAQIRNDLPGVKFERYTNYFDTFVAVTQGNADTALSFKYTFVGLKQSYPELNYIESNIKIPIVASFSPKASSLREQFNQFVTDATASGLLDELAKKWMGGYGEITEDDIVDFSDLNGENGSFIFAIDNTNIPYEYITNGQLNGFEPALLHEFCMAYGYKPEIIQTKFDSVVAGLSTGKYDMGMNGYGYTEERAENSYFSKPYFYDSVVYTVMGSTSEGKGGGLKESFIRNFITQDRWKLLINGLLVTIAITVLSVLIGSLLGFLLFLLSRNRDWITRVAIAINNTLEALPILVVLMVFFYIIFSKSSISGVVVSVIVFTMSFTFTFFALLRNSVKGVPIDQTEAGLALGYTDKQTLFKVVLPQAMEAFIPSIRSAIIATLKSTAIVGYVAVQDLTKAGDIIRSQTFDAFLPIITVAILYFAIAKILIVLLNRLLVTPEEMRARRREGK